MYNDILSDFLNRVSNAAKVEKESVSLPTSRAIKQVADSLKSLNYLKSVKVEEGQLVVELNPEMPVSHIKRLSRPSLRRYVKSTEIPRPKSGYGVVIVSTPKGILTSWQARKQKVGGELICEIW